MGNKTVSNSLLDPKLLQSAVIESFRKLSFKQQLKNPVMFVNDKHHRIFQLLFEGKFAERLDNG